MRQTNEQGLNLSDVEIFTGYKQKYYGGHKRMPTSLTWSPDGKYLVTAQNYIRLWAFDEDSGLQKSQKAKGHDSLIDEIKFFDQNLLSTLSRDQLKFWDLRQTMSKPIKTEKKGKQNFISVTWKNDLSQPIYTLLNKDNTISMFDLREGMGNNKMIETVKAQFDVLSMAWDKTDSVLFCGGVDSGQGVLNLLNGELEPVSDIFVLHTSKINSLAVDNTNNYLATCSDDSMVQINSLPEVLCKRTYSYCQFPYKKVAFSHNGDYLAASCDEAFMDIYNVSKGGKAFKIKSSINQEHFQWHPKKNIIAIIDEDQKKKLSQDKNQQNIRIFAP